MANEKRRELMRKMASAKMSGQGNNFKDGKYRLAVKRLGFHDGFKGTRWQGTFTVVAAQKIPVQSAKTGERLDIEPDRVGSDVDWLATDLDNPKSVGPGKLRNLLCTLVNDTNLGDEDYFNLLAEVSDVDAYGDPLPPDQRKEPAKGMIIDMETLRIVTQTNKVEIVVCKWSHVPESEYDQEAVKKWLLSVSAWQVQQAAQTAQTAQAQAQVA